MTLKGCEEGGGWGRVMVVVVEVAMLVVVRGKGISWKTRTFVACYFGLVGRAGIGVWLRIRTLADRKGNRKVIGPLGHKYT